MVDKLPFSYIATYMYVIIILLATALKSNVIGEKSSQLIPFQNACRGKLDYIILVYSYILRIT